MASHSEFTVRASATTVCMGLAQYAPDRVPVDILITLSVYDEDWYVQAPANAALKAPRPAVLRIFFMRLHSSNPGERTHAAYALASIADKEPELPDTDELAEGAVTATASRRQRSIGLYRQGHAQGARRIRP